MLGAIARTAITIRPVHAIDEAILAQMWALYEPHHNMDLAEFEEKLMTLDEVALFTRRSDRSLIGFCGVRRRVVDLAAGRKVATFYMGLTYVEREWRSNALVQRVVIRRNLGPLFSPRFHRVYFWCDCLTYRPYLVMARNLREYYPSRKRAASKEVREVIATLGRAYYGDNFDEEAGTVRKQVSRVKQHEACVSAADLDDPDIRFYMERNREYNRGGGLLAICPMGVGNLLCLVGRQLRKGMLAPPKPPSRVRESNGRPAVRERSTAAA